MKPKDPEKIQSIYAATLKLVKENGLTGLTMAAIGKQAGIGMGTLYTYFESKEALINALFLALKGKHTERIFANLDASEPFRITFKRVFLNYLRNRIEQHEEHQFVEQAHVSHFLDAEAQALGDAAYTALFELLDAGKAQHLVKEIPNSILAAQLVGASNAFADLVVLGQATLDEAFVEAAFTLCWDSVKR